MTSGIAASAGARLRHRWVFALTAISFSLRFCGTNARLEAVSNSLFARIAVAVAVALAATTPIACSSSSEPTPTATLALALSVNVAAGSETHRCRFVKVDSAFKGYITSMRHEYTPGSHHLVLFRTDLTEIAAGSEGDLDCYAKGRDVMAHARGVLYASQTASGSTTLPEGVGLPIAAGEVLLLQAHYLNPGTAPLDAKVDVQVAVVPDTTPMRAEAGVLFFYDPFIVVPPGGRASALMRCAIAKDITLLSGVSHMHKRGIGFQAFVDPPAPAAELTSTPFYTSSDWNHPEALAAPLAIAAGSKLRFRCDYQNAAGADQVIQGQSAELDEMCVFTGLYYPAMTQRDDLCMGNADMVGAGPNKCSQSFECVQRCPAGTAPKLGGAGVPDVTSCWQKCFAESCPTAGPPLLTNLSCVRTKCGEACADVTAGDCVSCVLKNCRDAYEACNAHVCN